MIESLAYAAAAASLVLGIAVMFQARRSVASLCFFAGMMVFGVECLLQGISIRSSGTVAVASWQNATWAVASFVPGVWLAFSLSYCRGNYREFLYKWRLGLVFTMFVPPSIAFWFLRDLVLLTPIPEGAHAQWLTLSPAAQVLNVLFMGGFLLVLANFERTFLTTVGTMRWRAKFALLGLGLIFGTRVYTRSLTLLFSRLDLSDIDFETGSILLGCVMIGTAHLRKGFSEVDVYPSHAFLRKSVTLILAGCYLFAVGVLAQTVKWLGGSSTFHLQIFIILAGVAGLGVLLLSERLRQSIRSFVSHHLRRPQYDFRQVWQDLTKRLASACDEVDACAVGVQMLSETFNALSVTIWLADDERHWGCAASTGTKNTVGPAGGLVFEPSELVELTEIPGPFELEKTTSAWAHQLQVLTQPQFSSRTRLAVVLRAGQRVLGLAILSDRVNQAAYTLEELELLQCLIDQLAAGLLNFRYGREVALARELETFQTMSAFFVHDLKNSASSLNLMLQNLPQHYDNPEFREDALRGLARTTGHINNLIVRLSSFREQLELNLSQTNLDELITDIVEQLGPRPASLVRELSLSRSLPLDRERIKSVITNLITNAQEATLDGGSIRVKTEAKGDHAVLTVSDEGCGMTTEFLRRALFRPFQTTKKKGIGIGMFQARMIVEAHRGRIHVESELQKGTTFQITFPF